jgi:hypothetical protein
MNPSATACASIIAVLFLCAGCGRSNSGSPTANAEINTDDPKEVQAFSHADGTLYKKPRPFVPGPELAGKTSRDPQYLLAWHRFNTVEEYKRIGRKNPAWDAEAIEALEAYAAHMSGPQDLEGFERDAAAQRIAGPATKAIEAKCDDPLIRYLHAVYVTGGRASESPEQLEKATGAAADALAVSDYPSIRKAFASYRATMAFWNVHGHAPKLHPRASHLIRSSVNYLCEALFDTTMPPQYAYLSCRTIVDEFDNNSSGRHDMAGSLIPTLQKCWKDHAWAEYIVGCVYLAKAWEARGVGFANTVDGAGWKTMRERLVDAEKHLKKSFEMDPTDWRVPVKMIKVVMMEESGRAEMEKWFDRAMKIDPNCYEAVSAKIWFLEPRWYSDRDAALEFARECVASKKWAGRIPLALPRLHASLQAYYKIDQATYYSDPQVWKDIHSAYKRFFELNPTEVGMRHAYARDAYRCGQYAIFLEQLPLFTTGTNFNYFGSKPSFDAMVRLAQENAARPTSP